jgi:hypothetical protein
VNNRERKRSRQNESKGKRRRGKCISKGGINIGISKKTKQIFFWEGVWFFKLFLNRYTVFLWYSNKTSYEKASQPQKVPNTKSPKIPKI